MEIDECPFCGSARLSNTFGRKRKAHIWRFSCLDCRGVWELHGEKEKRFFEAHDERAVVPVMFPHMGGCVGVYCTEEIE